tara:strand:- start:5804 stop:6118 length:315 start_codon:yes stop_codon:yes gene_type:complete
MNKVSNIKKPKTVKYLRYGGLKLLSEKAIRKGYNRQIEFSNVNKDLVKHSATSGLSLNEYKFPIIMEFDHNDGEELRLQIVILESVVYLDISYEDADMIHTMEV